MSSSLPFEQLTGTLTVYVAPVGEALPNVNATPGGNWYTLGPTDGDQKISHGGALTFFRDNEHQGPVKAVRPEEMVIVTFTLVGLSLEDYARAIATQANLADATVGVAVRTLPLKRGATPAEFALLFKGTALSPYGAFPGYYYIPRGCFDGEPEAVFAKDGRPGLEVAFSALEDDTQAAANTLGFLRVQTS